MSEPPEASFEAALAAFHSGAIDQARAIAEDAVTRHPAPRWHHLLGLIRCRLGDFDGGVELFRLLGTADKRLSAYPGAHAEMPPEGADLSRAFLAERLKG